MVVQVGRVRARPIAAGAGHHRGGRFGRLARLGVCTAPYALPYEQRIFAAVHEAGAVARLHICGDTNRIVPDMVATGADIVDLD